MIRIKNIEEISKIHSASKLSKILLEKGFRMAKPGVKTIDIDQMIDAELEKNGATSWFKEVNNYPYSTCISVNSVWVHGMPNDEELKIGDIISIDLGVKLDGFYADHCWTLPVKENLPDNVDIFNYFDHEDDKVSSFLQTGIESLNKSIDQFRVGNRLGDISYEMQKGAEDKGYSVIREYTGHGVGLDSHESPHITCYGTKGAGPVLKNGMVFAIEIMYSMGSPELKTLDDGWSVTSNDDSLTGMFEHTVALVDNVPKILTI